ncbi:class I glutamine amidotransferase-like protein [Mucidula mucida]|nr:class I glutamine amidotransferase-like protein [Mucidula mucida]KAF8903413.1 class I glutamine amidotransferase-like protein [Mucidula mucida]
MSQPQILKFAFCLVDDVTLSDFIPPSEILLGLNFAGTPMCPEELTGPVPYRVEFDFLAPTLEPVKSFTAPTRITVNPTQTYAGALAAGTQYDVLWVPAGPLPDFVTGEDKTSKDEIEFIKAQAPKAKYICSVCAGSSILAAAGVLSGKKATTNKAFYKMIVAAAPKDINWVAKARWVVDGNIWTSSGVSAGSDMALAFLAHLAGDKLATMIRNSVEVDEHGQDDDPFAKVHGLV